MLTAGAGPAVSSMATISNSAVSTLRHPGQVVLDLRQKSFSARCGGRDHIGRKASAKDFDAGPRPQFNFLGWA